MGVSASSRQIGTVFQVRNEHLNDWADFAGQDINVEVAYKETTTDPWDPAHWRYRGQAAMCLVTNGTKIVRVRIGDGSTADRNVYYQEITDPTVTSQWTTWTLLYSGTHYAIAIEPTTAASYNVYTSKSDGFYVNNAKKFAAPAGTIIRIKPVQQSRTVGQVYFSIVDQDVDGDRLIDWYYCVNVTTPTTRIAEAANYRWYRHDLCGAVEQSVPGPDFMYVTHAVQAGANPRSKIATQKLLTTSWPMNAAGSPTNVWDKEDTILGPSAQAGYKTYQDLYVFYDSVRLTYFMFFTEEFHDVSDTILSNLRRPLYWSRSGSLPQDWSEPAPVGYTVWGFSGVVNFGSYTYAAGNGRVMRHLNTDDFIDLSNYVLEGSYQIPRDGQKATGTITLANPDNVVGDLLQMDGSNDTGFTEQQVFLVLGTKQDGDTAFTWKLDADWWLARVSRAKDADKQHLIATIEGFKHRMENPFPDTIALPGHLDYADWSVGAVNQLSNWSNDQQAAMTRLNNGSAFDLQVHDGNALYTGWRGENGYVSAHFYNGYTAGRLIFRYQDTKNFMYADYDGTNVGFHVVANGTDTAISKVKKTLTGGFDLAVDFRWNVVQVYYNGALVITGTPTQIYNGFVGIGVSPGVQDLKVNTFIFSERTRALTTADLLTKLLNWSEEFFTVIDTTLTNAPQLAVLWGPQSDASTPAKAFDQLIETGKLDLAHRDYPGLEGLAYLIIGRFGDQDAAYTIEDEILSYAQVNEGSERPNVIIVDGNTDSWIEYDRPDLLTRQRPLNSYFDLPELKSSGDVRARAIQEGLAAPRNSSPGGDVVWSPQFTHMDTITWTNDDGSPVVCRIEGITVSWNQGDSPFQRATIDAGVFVYCPPDTSIVLTYLARDTFKRSNSSGWGSAQVGGTWVAE